MTINIKNFLNDKSKLSKMGEFQSLKQIDGMEMASISADLYKDGRDDLALFYFAKGANYATLTTSNSITSEFIPLTTPLQTLLSPSFAGEVRGAWSDHLAVASRSFSAAAS